MGEAKRRGSFEERKERALVRKPRLSDRLKRLLTALAFIWPFK